MAFTAVTYVNCRMLSYPFFHIAINDIYKTPSVTIHCKPGAVQLGHVKASSADSGRTSRACARGAIHARGVLGISFSQIQRQTVHDVGALLRAIFYVSFPSAAAVAAGTPRTNSCTADVNSSTRASSAGVVRGRRQSSTFATIVQSAFSSIVSAINRASRESNRHRRIKPGRA